MHFSSKWEDCGWRSWFSFCLDGLQFLKHAAFEDSIANQRGLRLLWSISKGYFLHLTTTAVRLQQCQNTKQAWPPNISPQPSQSTLVTRLSQYNAFNSALIYCCLKKNILTSAHWMIQTFVPYMRWQVLQCIVLCSHSDCSWHLQFPVVYFQSANFTLL